MRTFVMMSGIARSGKSTWVKQQAELFEREGKTVTICSSDAIREEMGMNQYNPQLNQKVFDTMLNRSIEGLKNTDVTFYDATNLNNRKREITIEAIRAAVVAPFKVLHVFMLVEPEELFKRATEHNFPHEVIMKQLKGFQSLGSVAYKELRENKRSVQLVYDGENAKPVKYIETLKQKAKEFGQNNPYHRYTLYEHSHRLVYIAREHLKNSEHYNYFDYFGYGYSHDLGKLYTEVKRDDGYSSYPGHANVSAYIFMLAESMRSVVEENIFYILEMSSLIQEHMNIKFAESEKALSRLKERLTSPNLLSILVQLALFDKIAQR